MYLLEQVVKVSWLAVQSAHFILQSWCYRVSSSALPVCLHSSRMAGLSACVF